MKSDLAKLYEILEQEKKLLDSPPDQSLDAQFHCAIAASTQNAMLAEIVRYIWDVRNRDPLWQTLTKESDQEEYSRKGFAEHEEIVAALQRKDPIAARQSMWQHLRTSSFESLNSWSTTNSRLLTDSYLNRFRLSCRRESLELNSGGQLPLFFHFK